MGPREPKKRLPDAGILSHAGVDRSAADAAAAGLGRIMRPASAHRQSLPVGVVIRRSPGVTRWAGWLWRPVALLPGAAPARWALLRRDGPHAEYHAATVPLTLWASDTEAYRTALSEKVPHAYVVLRETDAGDPGAGVSGAGDRDGSDPGLEVLLVTASPYEAQDYADAGEDIVEKVPMTEGLIGWVRDFVEAHHVDTVFVKRRRDRARVDLVEDGRGDPRIAQLSDVYRAPRPRSGGGGPE